MLRAILPEILLIILAALVMAVDLARPRGRQQILGWMSAGGLGLILVASLVWAWPQTGTAPIFGGLVRNDFIAYVFRLLFLFSGLIVSILSTRTAGPRQELRGQGEYYALVIVAVFGMNLMAMASDVIMLYLALETASLALYLLAGFLCENKSAEAGFKYFIFGAVAATIMVYGFSFLYGFTGQTNLYAIGAALAAHPVPAPLLTGAALLVLIGLGFKVAIVPFHFWAPDVYEGAPTPITAFISVASKAAGFAVLSRVMLAVFPAVQSYWVAFVMALAILTMTLGNLLALPQRNIKRLLAYSSIAQAGYALVGLVVVSPAGLAATVFYLTMYTVTNLTAFGVVILVTRSTGSDDISSLAGLSRRSPTLALVLLVAFLSLAGIPPLGGFVGKFLVFAAAIQRGTMAYIALAVIGVLNSIVGLYYYLAVVRVVYLQRSETENEKLPVPRVYAAGLATCMAGILLLGIWASPWIDWATAAAHSLF